MRGVVSWLGVFARFLGTDPGKNRQTNKKKIQTSSSQPKSQNFSSTVTERINLKLEANTFNVGIYLNWVGCGSGRHKPQYTTMEAERRVLGGWRVEGLD